MLQSKPSARQPTPCGRPDWLAHGRGPSQLGWYEWVAGQKSTKVAARVLDYGAGIGAGAAYMKWLIPSAEVWAVDNDDRLRSLRIDPIEEIEGIEFGVVTCIDVIEHVVDDLAFFADLKQLARRAVYITTPNLTHSHCLNEHHAREYTCAEFAEIFKPDELWGGSPDGWKRERLSEPSEKWEHIAGVFYVD